MFTRKFFRELAAKYARMRPAYTDSGDVYQLWESMVVGTANTISAQNSSFDQDRFLAACDHNPAEWWERHRQWASAGQRA